MDHLFVRVFPVQFQFKPAPVSLCVVRGQIVESIVVPQSPHIANATGRAPPYSPHKINWKYIRYKISWIVKTTHLYIVGSLMSWILILGNVRPPTLWFLIDPRIQLCHTCLMPWLLAYTKTTHPDEFALFSDSIIDINLTLENKVLCTNTCNI